MAKSMKRAALVAGAKAALAALAVSAAPGAATAQTPTPPAPETVSLIQSRGGPSRAASWIDMTSLRRAGDRVTYWELTTFLPRERAGQSGAYGRWTLSETDCRTEMNNRRAEAAIDGDVRYGPVEIVSNGMFSNGFRPIVYPEGLQVMRLVCNGTRPFPGMRPLRSVGAALMMAGMVR
ncbi:MAG: hypothetical protein ACT6RD_08160 [Brevundimonas sp.]|uniref:hypothetical protein n=1 Tax=Brevundimonas sp. TaxID=1871086 RepID=UPI004034EEE4